MSERPEPKRIQRKRTKGWRMPEGAVYVGRGSRWGNPFRIGSPGPDDCMVCADRAEAVAKFRSELTTYGDGENFTGFLVFEVRDELRGKDLACWCPLISHGLYTPCHADVLLSIANGISMEDVIRENTRWAEGQAVR